MRIGFGYDAHAFSTDRALYLCGVQIQHSHGLKGHSDADVALHALIDALLGAAALGDIGAHFPSSNEAYRNISSAKLLGETLALLAERQYAPSNIDITIVCEKPSLAPYIEPMRRRLAEIMDMSIDAVSVKATTTEKMGFTGREEGIAAYAVTLIDQISDQTADGEESDSNKYGIFWEG